MIGLTEISTALKSPTTATVAGTGISFVILVGWLETAIGVTVGIMTVILLWYNIRNARKKNRSQN